MLTRRSPLRPILSASIARCLAGATALAMLGGFGGLTSAASAADIYWKGQSGNGWTGVNWTTDAAGTTAAGTPTTTSDVIFSATGATHQDTLLLSNFIIHSLTINDPTAVTVGGAKILTINGAADTGISVNAGAGLFVIDQNVKLTLAGSSNRITVNNTAGAVVRGVIQGSNGLVKAGTERLTLTGDNTYTGGTTILDGILRIGNGGTTGSILGNVTNNGILSFDRSNAVSFGGAITGTGTVRNAGAGTTTFTGDSAYGDLEVRNGKVILAGNETTLNSLDLTPVSVGSDDHVAALLVQNGAHLDATGGKTNIVTGLQGTNATVDGAGSSWEVGFQLVIGRDDYGAGKNYGAVTVQNSGQLSVESYLVVGAESGNGTLLVQSGGQVSSGNGTIGFGPRGFASASPSAPASVGYVTITGAGSLWTIDNELGLGGFDPSHYGGTGTLDIRNGAVATVVGRTTLWTSASSILVDKGTFSTGSLSNLAGTTPTIAISDNGGPGPSLEVGSDGTDSTYSGTIVDGTAGAGSFRKIGAGTLTLTGTNTYTGATAINGGKLLVNGALGNTATTINTGGTLGGSGAIAGPVTLNSGGFIAPGASATAPSTGTLSTGALTWNGGGKLQLELGTTSDLLAITGALTKGTAGAFGIEVTAATGFGAADHYTLATFTAGTTFALTDFTLSTLPAGYTGTLSLDGDSLDLALALTLSGRIIQNSAPVGTPTFADFVVDGAVTTGNPNESNTIRSLTFLTGGSLEIFQTLFITSGPVNLVGGASLHLNNSTLSANALNVLFGGWLHGNGTIHGGLFNAGLVSPGNSPGQIHVTGDYQQASSGTLRIEVGGTSENEHDRLVVDGHAKLDGTLELVRLNKFKLHRGDKITFLTAGRGVEGEFAHVDNGFVSDTILEPAVVYGDHAVSLEMIRGSFEDYADRAGLTPNQRATAAALDSVSADEPNDRALVYLDERQLDKLPGDFDKIAPEELSSIFTISTSLANVQGLNLQRRTDDLRHGSSGFSAGGLAMQGTGPGYSGSWSGGGAAGPTGKESKESKTFVVPDEKKWGVFLTGVGEWVDVDGDGNARGYDITTGGFTLGLDYRVCSNFAVGIAAGYAGTAADLTDDGRVWVNGGKLGVYATTFIGGWYADVAVTGGYNSYDTKRSALQGTARGSTDGGELNVLVGTGYDWHVGALQIGPTATFQYTLVGMDGFAEHGSLAPLEIAGRNAESVGSALGFKASYDWKLGGVLIKPEIRAAWQHEYGDKSYDISAGFASGAGDQFLVNGPEIGRDSLLLGAGFAIQCSESISTYVYYDGELGRDRYDRHSVSGGVRIAF